MRLQDLSYILKAVADVAQAGEQLLGSFARARSRGHVGSVLVGVGLGVGLGALLFSEPARRGVWTWLGGVRAAVQRHDAPTVTTTVESNGAGHAAVAPFSPH